MHLFMLFSCLRVRKLVRIVVVISSEFLCVVHNIVTFAKNFKNSGNFLIYVSPHLYTV